MKKFTAMLLSTFYIIQIIFSGSAVNTALIGRAAEIPESQSVLNITEKYSIKENVKAYLLMDENTGTVITAENENAKLYPASVTKIMSLLLICEAITSGKLSLDEQVVCSVTAAEKGGSQIWLEPNETMTVNELLKAVCVYSANDACTLLGEKIAGSEEAFVKMMNEKAQELGMKNTHYDNCTGLDDDTTAHLSTAYDIAIVSRELLKYDLIRNYTLIWMDTLRNGETQLVNTNKLVRYYKGITGLKTGTTSKAGCCVSATAERDGLSLIAVVLGASNSKERFAAAAELLDYGFANYEIFTPKVDEENLSEIKVRNGVEKSVMPKAKESAGILVNKGIASQITQNVELNESTEAPVKYGDVLGSVTFSYNGEVLLKTELTAGNDVDKLTLKTAVRMILESASKSTDY